MRYITKIIILLIAVTLFAAFIYLLSFDPLTVIRALLFIMSIFLTFQGIVTIVWMLYVWENPQGAKKRKSQVVLPNQNIPVKSVEEGLNWLKKKGYQRVGKVKMVNTNYEYKTGIVGLYVIDEWLHSVILDFPEGDHEKMEKEFGLQDTEVIKLPYNKYLEKQGKLQKIEL